MSIFISKEAKKKVQGYWGGLLIPIVVGWGCSLFSLAVLISRDTPVSETSYVDYFHMVLWVGGHLVVYPLCAWWLIRRAKKGERILRIKGAYMSIKLYIVSIVLFLFSGVSEIISILWGV